jgi:hypothetical protein
MHLEEIKLFLLAIVLVALLFSTRSSARGGAPVEAIAWVDPLPHALTAYALYSWQVGQEWYFTLTTDDHQASTYQEITSGENVVEETRVKITMQGVYGLEAVLDQLPPGSDVVWTGPKALRQIGVKPVDLILPSRKMIQSIEAYCAPLDIQLRVDR